MSSCVNRKQVPKTPLKPAKHTSLARLGVLLRLAKTLWLVKATFLAGRCCSMCVALNLELKHYKHQEHRKHHPPDTCGLLGSFFFYRWRGRWKNRDPNRTSNSPSLSKASGRFWKVRKIKRTCDATAWKCRNSKFIKRK